jgi:CheY-like chemotaxis protein
VSVAVASDRWSLSSQAADPPRSRSGSSPAPRTERRGGEPTPLPRRRVLVVEDNPALRETMADILGGSGYGVETAEDGLAALEAMSRSSFDVVILDLAMPRLDGIGLLQHVGDHGPAVIICSAFEYYSPEQVEAEAGSKVFRSLRKPVPPDELVSAVAEAVASEGGPGTH